MKFQEIWGDRPAFLGIDMQVGILSGCAGENQSLADLALQSMLGRIGRVQERSRKLGIPVLHVQHFGPKGHRLDPDTEGWSIFPDVAPQAQEPIIAKGWCDAFFDTDLDAHCRNLGIETLAIAGCMTQFCIDTTCRRALALGYNVILLEDGHMNAGSLDLSFEQVIRHHNATLAQIDAGKASLRVRRIDDLLS